MALTRMLVSTPPRLPLPSCCTMHAKLADRAANSAPDMRADTERCTQPGRGAPARQGWNSSSRGKRVGSQGWKLGCAQTQSRAARRDCVVKTGAAGWTIKVGSAPPRPSTSPHLPLYPPPPPHPTHHRPFLTLQQAAVVHHPPLQLLQDVLGQAVGRAVEELE